MGSSLHMGDVNNMPGWVLPAIAIVAMIAGGALWALNEERHPDPPPIVDTDTDTDSQTIIDLLPPG